MIFDKTKLLSVYDATKDQEPMPYGKAERGHSPDTKILAIAGTGRRAAWRKEYSPMTTGDVILAVLVVFLGAVGTF